MVNRLIDKPKSLPTTFAYYQKINRKMASIRSACWYDSPSGCRIVISRVCPPIPWQQRELYYDLKISTLPNIIMAPVLLAYKRVRIVEDTPYCRLIRLIVFYCIQWAIIAYFLLLLALSIAWCGSGMQNTNRAADRQRPLLFFLSHSCYCVAASHSWNYIRESKCESERERGRQRGGELATCSSKVNFIYLRHAMRDVLTA